jgi:hypothetical protein
MTAFALLLALSSCRYRFGLLFCLSTATLFDSTYGGDISSMGTVNEMISSDNRYCVVFVCTQAVTLVYL